MATAALITRRSRHERALPPVFLPGEWGERLGEHGIVVGAPSLSSPDIDSEALTVLAHCKTLSRTLSETANNVCLAFYISMQSAGIAKSSIVDRHTSDTTSTDYNSIPMRPTHTVKAKLRWLPRSKPMAFVDE